MRTKYWIVEPNAEPRLIENIDLYFKYKSMKLVDSTDIKYVGWFDEEFIPYRMDCGDSIFFEQEKPFLKILTTVYKGISYSFFSIEEVVFFLKENNLSKAADGVIKRSVINNLIGKTKQSYGLNWSIKG